MVHAVALLLVVFGLLSDAGSVASASASPFSVSAVVLSDDGSTCGATVRLPHAAAEADDFRDTIAAPLPRFMPLPLEGDAFGVAPSHSAESRVTQPPDRPPRRHT
ncbi:hypothetical protein [Methylobacterium sp. J-090]|uniref:hypothetical protein n=1 Tax=Methylobacterium sp. J-090 TaxID=2836666 RepID=UPI001FBBE29D|nr:hypothetical protein [Methylobacterium sp. J-090]MCJ2082354.1 hypothetical protein [Methylobacterium sp. J-090]